MKTKKITALFCAMAITVFASVQATAAANTDWPQFFGSNGQTGITMAQTPVTAVQTALSWSQNRVFTDSYGMSVSAWGTPVTVGDFVYVTDSNGKLLKLNVKTGAVAAQADCTNIPSYFSQIAYGNGKIFVPQETAKGVTISAYDANSLSLAWTSGEITHGTNPQQIASPIIYDNGRIYFGTYAFDSSWAYAPGVYACIDTNSGAAVWQHVNPSASYYWNGGAIVGSAIAVADTNGNITTFQLADGAPVGTIYSGGTVSSTPTYKNGTLYTSVTSGYIFAVKTSESGAIDASTAVKSAMLGGIISSSPAVYNGRLYVAGGGYGSTAPFSVLDASTLKTIYQIHDIHSQSTPLVSAAYESGSAGHPVYVYVADYGAVDSLGNHKAGSSRVYVIKDSAGQTAPSYETLFTPSAAQSCSQSLIPSGDGTLFYSNDNGDFFALVKKAVAPSPSSKPVSGSADTSAPPLHSPKTGETPAAAVIFLAVLSGAVLYLKKK